MNRKIAILHPAYWEQLIGGAELQIKYLIEYSLRQGYKIHYIFEDHGTPIKNSYGISLYPLKPRRIRGLGESFILNSFEVYSLLKVISPNIIYTRLYSSWTGLATIFSKRFNMKHIWAIASNNDVNRKFDIGKIKKPLDFLTYMLVQYSFKYATQIISQNKYQQTQILIKYKRDSIRITQSGESEEENNIKKNDSLIKVLWIANFKSLKQPEIFKMLASSLQIDLKYKMIMIGDLTSPYNKKDWNIPEIKLYYLGKKTIQEINEILNEAHILINTSKYEGFSNTFIQAFMRKVPVISMNSNPDNILTEKSIGFVCPTFNELVEKTELLIINHQLRNEMGKKAYNYAIENHSIEKIMPIILEFFND